MQSHGMREPLLILTAASTKTMVFELRASPGSIKTMVFELGAYPFFIWIKENNAFSVRQTRGIQENLLKPMKIMRQTRGIHETL